MWAAGASANSLGTSYGGPIDAAHHKGAPYDAQNVTVRNDPRSLATAADGRSSYASLTLAGRRRLKAAAPTPGLAQTGGSKLPAASK